MNETNGLYKSPDKKHGIDFLFAGEIRYGPEYSRLKLDGVLIPNRIFGIFIYKWHPQTKYLALQEWLTIDFRKGPITALTLIDVENNKIAQLSKADKGFIEPLRFENELIIFEKHYHGKGKKVQCEISMNEVSNWKSFV